MIKVIQPPASEEELSNTGQAIVESALKFGMHIEPAGFLAAWVTGMRLIAKTNDANEIQALAMMTYGRRWIANDLTGTVLVYGGADKESVIETLDFAKQIAAANGCRCVFIEETDVKVLPNGAVAHVVIEHIV